jgi:cytochrome c-type biogenesis protein CcmH
VITFIVICEILTFLAFAWVLKPLWRSHMSDTARSSTTERQLSAGEIPFATHPKSTVTVDEQARLEVYKDRRLEIVSELELGRLSADEAQRQQDDLVQEVSREFGETEVVRRSPVNRKSAFALALLGTTLSVFLYMTVGSPHLTDNLPSEVAKEDGQDPVRLIAELEAKVAANPKDAPSWAILGAAYKYTGQHAKSVTSFEKFFALEPAKSKPAARPLAEFAEVLALSKDGNFAGRPTELLQQALQLDPTEPKSLAMMGAAQFRAGNFVESKRHLTQLLSQMPADSPQAEQLRPLLAKIDEQLKSPSTQSAQSAQSKAMTEQGSGADKDQLAKSTASETKPLRSESTDKAAQAASESASKAIITGRIILSPKASSGEALKDVKAIFVSVKATAREANAQPGQVESAATRAMPIAALKINEKFSNDLWPLRFSLSDDQSLRPQSALSQANDVVLEVHLSRSGLPGKNSGDWFGKIGPFKPGDQLVEVIVDQQLP